MHVFELREETDRQTEETDRVNKLKTGCRERDPQRVRDYRQARERERVSKQITNTKSKCTNKKTAWIPLWCIL